MPKMYNMYRIIEQWWHCTKFKGQLIHLNTFLFEFLSSVDNFFSKHYKDLDVFEKVITDVTSNTQFKYTCSVYIVDVTTEI